MSVCEIQLQPPAPSPQPLSFVIQSQSAIHHGGGRVIGANLIIVLDNVITHGSLFFFHVIIIHSDL